LYRESRQYIGAYRLPTVGDRRAGNRRYNGNVSGEDGSPLARTSLGRDSGWAGLMLLAASDAIRRITAQALWRWALHAQIFIVPLVLLFSGTFNDLPCLKNMPTARMSSTTPWRNI
jgi:hypothetical protein